MLRLVMRMRLARRPPPLPGLLLLVMLPTRLRLALRGRVLGLVAGVRGLMGGGASLVWGCRLAFGVEWVSGFALGVFVGIVWFGLVVGGWCLVSRGVARAHGRQQVQFWGCFSGYTQYGVLLAVGGDISNDMAGWRG